MSSAASRPDPTGKPVSIFITCMVDMLYPQAGMSMVKVLDHLGIPATFPEAQTCCGQPAFNAGYWSEARAVATRFVEVFREAEVIVAPSGSCVAMVRHEYTKLAGEDVALKAEVERLGSITWEFSEYLVEGLGIRDVGGELPESQTFAFHDACHGLRLLGLGNSSRQLIERIPGAVLIDLPGSDVCCGFGGLFSVKMADVSGGMLAKKKAAITACPATVLCGDVSCMTHINGGLEQAGESKRVRHFAEILAESLEEVA